MIFKRAEKLYRRKSVNEVEGIIKLGRLPFTLSQCSNHSTSGHQCTLLRPGKRLVGYSDNLSTSPSD